MIYLSQTRQFSITVESFFDWLILIASRIEIKA